MAYYFRTSAVVDQACEDLEAQAKTLADLEWHQIELRGAEGVPVEDWTPHTAGQAAGILQERRIHVTTLLTGFGGKDWPANAPFDVAAAKLRHLCALANLLNAGAVRVYGWSAGHLSPMEWRQRAISRWKTLGRIAQNEGVQLVLENGCGWEGTSLDHFRRFLESVDLPNFRASLDVSHPVLELGKSPLEWYLELKPYIDTVRLNFLAPGEKGAGRRALQPGEVSEEVREILGDLKVRQFRGIVAFDPDINLLTNQDTSQPKLERVALFKRCARAFEEMLGEVRPIPARSMRPLPAFAGARR